MLRDTHAAPTYVDGGGDSFAALLRGHRLLAALSQEELSTRALISVRALRDLEAGRVGRPRPRTVGLLADALALAGDERCAFTAAALSLVGSGTDRAGVPVTAPPSPLTPLIGRSDEVTRVLRALSGPARLVTVTGLGGVGKTRLALAVASRIADGRVVAWVPLSGLAGTAAPGTSAAAYAVIDAVAQAVGVPGAGLDGLPDALSDFPTVVLLDACEHLPGVGVVVEELLARCPRLTVLATSRGPVGILGEYEHPLGPLAVPEPGAEPDTAAFAGVPAVRLLLDRISARRPAFSLDESNADAVARLCRRLGGLPLALELAAAQCRVRDPADLLAEPAGRLLDLTDPRPRTDPTRLRTAIAGSVALLDVPSRRALARLSVFAGGWTLAAAAAVLDDHDIVAVLDTLVAYGIAMDSPAAGGARFAMLDMIREHASERARADGGLEDAARRHAAYFGRLVLVATANLEETLAPESLATLDAERDNIRVALDWCGRHDRLAGVRIVEALKQYWFMRSRYPEAARWLTKLLPSEQCGDVADDAHISCYSQGHRYAAVCWLAMGEPAKAFTHARAALAYAERTDDEVLVAAARSAVGRTLFYLGDPIAAERHLRAAFIASVHSGHWAAVLAAAALADLLSSRGDIAEARRVAEDARDVAVAGGLTASLPWAWHAMARAAWRAGDLGAVRQAASAMLDLCDNRGDCPAIRLRALAYLAATAAAEGRAADGRRAVDSTRRLVVSAGQEDRALVRWARVEVALAAEDGVIEAAAAALPEVAVLSNRPYLIDVLSALALATVDRLPVLAAHAAGHADAASTRHSVAPTSLALARLSTVAERGREVLGEDGWASAVRQGATLPVHELITAVGAANCR